MTLVLTCAALAVAGCGHLAADPPPFQEAPVQKAPAPAALSQPVAGVQPDSRVPAQAAPPARPAPPPAGCPSDTGWSCLQQQRFARAGAYINRHAGGHGYLSVVFTDRQTGRVWRYGPTQHEGWTASTIKLAIATDLLRRQRAHQIALSAADRTDLAAMLHSSDNPATDRLWAKFGGESMLARFRTQYGMTGLHFVPGFTRATYWGFVKCTADDMAALLRYLFAQVNPDDRGYLVGALRGVAPNQQWGVWAAGRAQQPGNKDGWSFESDTYGKHWVTNTAGFAGPDERYLISVMYQVDPSGTLAGGVHAVSDVVALLFGEPVPAPVTVPAPDG